MKRSAFLIWPLLATALLPVACTEEPPLSLAGEDREIVDTLYSRRVPALREELDSLCDALFERKLQATVDSMLEVRRAEEAALRRRIPVIDQ